MFAPGAVLDRPLTADYVGTAMRILLALAFTLAVVVPAGTRVYAVRGHPTGFRLAAVWQDRIFLYQAWRNPRAKAGGDLWAIAGKVRSIDVQRGVPLPGATRTPAVITSSTDVETLVAMIVRGTMRRPRAP